MDDKSFVYWYSGLERHLCGYCKNKKGNISHGMWAKTLTVEDYQNLIDRGWRRSGNYCYKPLMSEICCPMYTIKCEARNFQLCKSQKKVIKKLNKFLRDGELNKTPSFQNHETSDNVSEFVYREAPKQVLEPFETDLVVDSDEVDSAAPETNVVEPSHSQAVEQSPRPFKTGAGADPSKPPCKKAKLLRLERRKEKLLKRGMSLEKIDVKKEQKTLEDFLNEAPEGGKHKLKLELISTDSRSERWDRLKKIEFELYRKYQMCVHNDPPEKCRMEGFLRFLVHSPLEITLEKIHENHKYFKLAAALYKKYQIFVHNEEPNECDEFQFLNFLVDSPLQHVRFSRDSEVGFGSFHQLYWLDDKLIAVGVIDVLPKCVSAVYFFYDPDYRDLTLGTYGSLREVEFARTLHEKIPSIEHYYMGFYIHSCPKMRYKGKLTPSYLLCPETYHWTPIEKCIPKLDLIKYSRLNEDEAATDQNSCSSKDIDGIKILVNRKVILFKQYKRKYGGHETFDTIGSLVGQKCAKSLIFIGDP